VTIHESAYFDSSQFRSCFEGDSFQQRALTKTLSANNCNRCRDADRFQSYITDEAIWRDLWQSRPELKGEKFDAIVIRSQSISAYGYDIPITIDIREVFPNKGERRGNANRHRY
jgi:hypothetical protein